jgi:D-alanyl-D-alanine carboxypeptidase/D-alanyl-D-alanine-endopeptidase (penicillin-binding protein 4)
MKIIRLLPLLSFVFFITASSLFTQHNHLETKRKIDAVLNDDFFNSSALAVDVYDLIEGQTVYQRNEKLLLHPASNLKLITSAAALKYLEDDFTFNTSIYYTGEIIDSVCTGNLFIVGGCDPDFSLEDLDTMITAITEAGINKIIGNIYGDVSLLDSLYWGNGWMWDDEPYMEFPHLTPLTINDACVKFITVPGNLGEPVKIKVFPNSDFFTFSNKAVIADTDSSTFDIKRDWLHGKNVFTAIGELPVNETTDTLLRNVEEPHMFFLNILKEKIIQRGIKFYGNLDTLTLPDSANLIYTKSRAFSNVINNLNKQSDNLTAEMTLRALAFSKGIKQVSADTALAVIDSLISVIGLDPDSYRIVDGSGVSHYNLVSAELLNKLLIHFYNNEKENFSEFYNSLPIAGVDGTLEKRMLTGKAYTNVKAKTGTLSGVSTLSGYLNSANGNFISFSILIQNYVEKDKIARSYIDKLCEILCQMD